MLSMTIREQQRRKIWRALQTAAINLVDVHGFAGVTVDDIASAAGVSRRTFFNHFPTKAAALFDPDPDDADRLASLLGRLDNQVDLWPALRSACVSFVTGHENVIAVRRRLIEDEPELDQYHRTAHQHVEMALRRWAATRPDFDPYTAELLTHSATAVLISAFSVWKADDDPAHFVTLVERGFDIISAGFPT
jgi:AcrR family transcriptional regulator